MTLRYVDGYKIRQTLDADFNILHFRHPQAGSFDSKWYIPEGEIWFDQSFRGEEEFLTMVETTEMTDRSREAYRRRFVKKGDPGNFVMKEERRDDLTVKYVEGKVVRVYLDPLFAMGGHDLVYPTYIAKGEIWIDRRLDSRDSPHILLHELTERKLMQAGKSYDVAHDYAAAAERESRRREGGVYIGDAGHPGILNIKDYYVG